MVEKREQAADAGSDRVLLSLVVVDVAAEARRALGDAVDAVAGREVPERDYRFLVTTDAGAVVTMHAACTATDVMAYLTHRDELPDPASVRHYPGCEWACGGGSDRG